MLEVGRRAPNFSLRDSDGKRTSLQDFRGRWVVLYFYPKDDTPGCTAEANEFSALQAQFEERQGVILGVSKDSVDSHDRFRCKYGLNIRLLSDPEAKVIATYGAWRKKVRYGKTHVGIVRSTYLIDPRGRIAEVWDNVKAKGHAREVLSKL